MTDNERRKFLRLGLAMVGTGSLAACGGGESGESLAADAEKAQALGAKVASPSGLPGDENRATTAAIALPESTGRMQFTVLGGLPWLAVRSANIRLVPFTLGHAFKRGDVPAGSSVFPDRGSLQVTPRNYWPDGSLRFAELAGHADLSSGSAVVALSVGPATGLAPAMTTAHLKRSGIQASIGCGSYGSVSWANTDWDTPFQTWTAGPEMASWIYRKPVGNDAHLVAWLELRLYAGGAVEVLPWIENGYVAVAAPTIKSATYTFKLDNAERFSAAINLRHHQRTPLVSGAALSYWNVADPQITLQHDAKYLMATELVPTYSAVVSPLASVVTDLPATYVPLQQGSFRYAWTATNVNTGFDRDDMTTGGYGPPIGLLPQHDMLYLVTTANTYVSVVRNGFSAGRYQIHYRDENTNRPLRFSDHPTRVMGPGSAFSSRGSSTVGLFTPTATGGNGAPWDTAHSPSVGYMAYLLTGRWYFMEEVLFAATANYLGNGNQTSLRNGSQGLVQPDPGAWQTRAAAWDWRSKVQALTVVPDVEPAPGGSGNTLRQELINCVESNIAHFHGRYVAQANNPFGFIQSGTGSYDGGTSTLAPWQQDFVTAVFGWAISAGLPISPTRATQLNAFFAWTAQSIVGRLGAADAGGYPYMNTGPYVLSVSSTAIPNYTTGAGPWRASWADIYAALPATLAAASSPSAWVNNTTGTLYGEFMPGERSFWGNLMPAISYAVRHGVAGAVDAYNRITSASNYAALTTAFNTSPVWSVKPASGLVVTPAWLAGKPLNQWFSIPGTAGAGGAAVDAFSGFAVREDTSDLACLACGGHLNASDNRVTTLRLEHDAPTWVVAAATPPAARDGRASLPNDATGRPQNVSHYPDGRPSSRHTYRHNHWVPGINRYMMVGAREVYANSPPSFATVDGFDPVTNLWDPAGTWPNVPVLGQFGACKDSAGNIYASNWDRFNSATGTWTDIVPGGSGPIVRTPMFHDSLRNTIVSIMWGDGFGFGSPQVNILRYDIASNMRSGITLSGSGLSQFTTDRPSYAGGDYCPDNDKFLFYDGTRAAAGRMYWITPNSGTSWDISIASFDGGTATLPQTTVGGISGMMWYVPRLKGFVLMPSAAAGLYFMRTG